MQHQQTDGPTNQFAHGDYKYSTDEEKLRAALEYIRFHRYTSYFEAILAYQAKIVTGVPKAKCYSNFYGIYELDSQVVNDLRAFCNEFDIDYDVILAQPRYDGKLDDLLIKDNARIKVNRFIIIILQMGEL